MLLEASLAYGIGILASAILLAILGILRPGMPITEITGKIAVQELSLSWLLR